MEGRGLTKGRRAAGRMRKWGRFSRYRGRVTEKMLFLTIYRVINLVVGGGGAKRLGKVYEVGTKTKKKGEARRPAAALQLMERWRGQRSKTLFDGTFPSKTRFSSENSRQSSWYSTHPTLRCGRRFRVKAPPHLSKRGRRSNTNPSLNKTKIALRNTSAHSVSTTMRIQESNDQYTRQT